MDDFHRLEAPSLGERSVLQVSPELVYVEREKEGFTAFWKDAGTAVRRGETFESFPVARFVTMQQIRRKYSTGQDG